MFDNLTVKRCIIDSMLGYRSSQHLSDVIHVS